MRFRVPFSCSASVLAVLALSLAPYAGAAGVQATTPATAAKPAPTAAEIASMQHQLADWPNLERYRTEDAALGAPASGVQRIVFMGDSITDNWGRKYGQFFPGKPYVNRGISGQTTPQMLVRFQQDVIDLKPAAVVILAGINDIAQNTGPEPMSAIENNFRSMVAIAKAAHVRVVLSSVLPASSFPWRPSIDPRPQVRELNAWLQDFARKGKLVYLNYYPALVGANEGMKPALAADGVVHPNDAGYALMAPLAEKAIAESLATPRP